MTQADHWSVLYGLDFADTEVLGADSKCKAWITVEWMDCHMTRAHMWFMHEPGRFHDFLLACAKKDQIVYRSTSVWSGRVDPEVMMEWAFKVFWGYLSPAEQFVLGLDIDTCQMNDNRTMETEWQPTTW